MSVPKAKRKTDPCPCGSGKQYRYCHGVEQDSEDEGPAVQRNPKQLFLWLVIVGAPLAWLLASQQRAPSDGTEERVWSDAHGHWHNVDGGEIGSPAASAPKPAPVPVAAAADGAAPAADAPADPPPAAGQAPPGPAPPGKVWAADHGHWHDVDGSTKGAEPAMFDPSSGKPWDHDYTIPRPDEERPGFTWSDQHGHWHPNE